MARGRYFLLLNPDTEVPRDALAGMIRFMDGEPGAALAGCRVENPDGSLQAPCRRRIPRPGASLAKLLGLDVVAKLIAQTPDGRLSRHVEPGFLTYKEMSEFPYASRPKGYYHREA